MALFINTNIASLYAQNNVANSQSALATSIQRLSSGLRINSAKDDAAGLAIAARMTSQIGGLTQAAQNANDGISLAQTAEGALAQVTNDLQTMRNLAVQAANGTNSASDRASLQASVSQLQQDINQIATNTQYNGLNLLDGTLTNLQFQIGANANQTILATVGNAGANAIGNYQVAQAGTTGLITSAVAGTGTAGTTADIAVNNVVGGTLTVAGTGANSSSALTITAGETAYAIAQAVNAAKGTTTVSASALTTATLDISGITVGNTVNLTLVGAPGSSVTISATPSSTTDVTSLAAQINAASGSTGITAIGDSTTGKISLTQAQGYDIGVLNNNAVATIKVAGSDTAATTKTLAANKAAGDAVTVGGAVTFNSSGSFTVTDTGTKITAAAAATASSSLQAVSGIDLTTLTNGLPTGANNALQVVDSAINTINGLRADLGALQNRFSNAQTSLTTTSTNLQQARSRIQDTDFAAETANLTHNQILQQAGTAMLAQANALPNSVLTLLK